MNTSDATLPANHDAMANFSAPESGIDPLLRRYLDSRVAHCPMCRRPLRGVVTNRCPMCGHTLALSLSGLTLPPFRWYLGFAGPVAGSGFHAFVVLAELSDMWWFGANWRPRAPIWSSLFSLTLLVVLATVWARWGFVALRARPVWVWSAVGFGWLASAGSITLFYYSL